MDRRSSMTRPPKARLTLEQHQRAINEAVFIDASPHEWPTVEMIPLLCHCILDTVEMVDFLKHERDRMAASMVHLKEAIRKFAVENERWQAVEYVDIFGTDEADLILSQYTGEQQSIGAEEELRRLARTHKHWPLERSDLINRADEIKNKREKENA
jgi:hypothetical protein